MLNDRITFVETREGFHFDHRVFPTKEALEKYANEIITRREAMAGRRLTSKEIVNGIERKDDRTIRQRMADEAWRPIVTVEPADEGNIFRQRLADMKEQRRLDRLDSRTAMLEKAAADLDAEHEATEQQAAFDADPRRQRAVTHAEAALEQVRFDPSATYSDVVRAKQRLDQARLGDLGEYKRMTVEFAGELDERKRRQLEELDAQRAELDRQRANIAGDKFEAEPPPPPANVHYPESYNLEDPAAQQVRDAVRADWERRQA